MHAVQLELASSSMSSVGIVVQHRVFNQGEGGKIQVIINDCQNSLEFPSRVKISKIFWGSMPQTPNAAYMLMYE